MDADSSADTAVPAYDPSSTDQAEQVLSAATILFATHGPKMITLKWVAKDAGIDVEWIAARWPTIRDLLAAVLDRSGERASDESPIVPIIHGQDFTETADALFDIHDRVIVRAILDDFKPAELMKRCALLDRLVADLISNGMDESAARARAVPIAVLELGWRLSAPRCSTPACSTARRQATRQRSSEPFNRPSQGRRPVPEPQYAAAGYLRT